MGRMGSTVLWSVLLVAGVCAAAGAEVPWLSSVDEGLKRAKAEKKLVFLEIASPKSPLCARRDAEVYSDAHLAAALGKFAAVRLDAERSPAEAAKWDPMGYPTLVVLQADGVEIARPLGTLKAPALTERLEEILADERALGEHQAKLAKEPNLTDSQLSLARIHLRRGNAAAAQPLVEVLAKSAAVNVREALPSLWLNLGMALGKGGPSPKGRECFERVTRDFPETREASQAHFILHMVYLMQGDRKAASRSLEKVLEGEPDDYLRERAERALRRLEK